MRIDFVAAQPDRVGRYIVRFEDGSVMRLYRQTLEDYGIYAMFRTVSKTENLSRYLHPALPILSDYDSRNGTQLELTLYTYLKCACSTTETADTLFLHRNSVIYRLHRIEDLCDIDLSDTDTGFRLRLSFAISYVINQRRTWSGKAPAAE